MGMFDTTVKMEEERDVLGGGGVFDSNLYDFTIKLAYVTHSAKGAMAVNLNLESSGRTLKQTIYISSKKDASGNVRFTYKDKGTGEDRPLPGYSQINSLCQLAIGKQLKDIDPEEKTISIYDFTAKKELPKQVPVLTELLNAEITIGVLKVLEDKTAKDASGNYVPTGETREVNTMGKFFKTEGRLTTAEIAAGETEGKFAVKWLDTNLDAVINKAKGVSANVGAVGIPTSSAVAPAATTSLFNK